MKKFHISENGPKPCKANIRDCPVGGAHFDTKLEAERAYELKASVKHGPFAGIRRKPDPFSRHLSDAQRRIDEAEKDFQVRDARQVNGTLYHELLEEGFTDEILQERFAENGNTREAGLGFLRVAEGEAPVIGLNYGGDYKAEEEYGIAAISRALRQGNYGPDDVLLYTREGFTVLAIRGERAHGWTRDPDSNEITKSAEETALKRYAQHYNWDDRQLQWKLKRESIATLRAELKGKVTPLPKTKDELISKVIELRTKIAKRTPAMGEFQNGRALVIVTQDPLEAKLMGKLKASHDLGKLRVGGSANPFSRGSLFYDERDISREQRSKLIRAEEAVKAAQIYAADTKIELSKRGTLFALSPQVDETLQDVRESKYWLNLSPRDHKQIMGPFTKEQLDRIAAGDYSDVQEKR